MRVKQITTITLLSSILLFFSSCENDEGFGGNSHIQGRIIKKIYNNDFSVLQEEMPAKDEDVFISFGDQPYVAEKTETSYLGNFTFEYLFSGDYKVFYYSKEFSVINSEKKEVIHEVSLSKGKTINLGELIIYDTYDFDEGNATIQGKVFVKNYFNSSSWPNLIVKDITPAQELEIYLTYGNHKQYDKRIRTNHDGTFAFTNLIKGNYLIYLYSEDVKGGTADIVIQKEIQITEKDQLVQLEDITIEKL